MELMKKLKMKNKDWDSNLTPEQNYILKQEGTEPPGSSPLNNEKREGCYYLAKSHNDYKYKLAYSVYQKFCN